MKSATILSALLFPLSALAATPVELPLPVVPDSLRQPVQRADYIIGHFYDALDFSRPEATDTASVEQNLVNFISLFPHASSPAVIDSAVSRLLSSAPATARDLILLSAEKYLYDTESPMTNEELYIPFARAAAPFSPLHEYQLAQCMLNRPGTPAADFAMTTVDGQPTSLTESLGTDRTMLIFYDPDCDLCHEVMAHIAAKPDVVSGAVKVIAVALTDEDALWRSDARNLSDGWIKARPTGDIEIDELYSVRGFPTILLLDSAGRVIAKNVKIQE